jgi:sn-glycerol 3-phosphate transport system permease protein
VTQALDRITTETEPASQPVRGRRRRVREAGLAYGLILPSLLVFAAFEFYPFLRNFYLTLYRTPPFPGLPSRWAGLDQVREVITSGDFRNSLKVTVLFALLTVPTGVILGLTLAVLAHQRLKGIGIFRTIFSSTVATSVAVASVIFFTLFNPEVGMLSYLLDHRDLLQDRTWALPAVSIAFTWQHLGITFILISAGLAAVPDELLEAAHVDGAGSWSRFRHVTLPLLSPTLFFTVIVISISAFQAFGQIDLLTEGGPGDRTNVLVYAAYKASIRENNPGEAAVLAIALFVITLALTIVQLRVLERRVFYGR